MLTGLWWLATYSLPIGVILVGGIFYRDDFYATRFWSSFYVGIGRTFYSLGVLLGILGMAQGNGCKSLQFKIKSITNVNNKTIVFQIQG